MARREDKYNASAQRRCSRLHISVRHAYNERRGVGQAWTWKNYFSTGTPESSISNAKRSRVATLFFTLRYHTLEIVGSRTLHCQLLAWSVMDACSWLIFFNAGVQNFDKYLLPEIQSVSLSQAWDCLAQICRSHCAPFRKARVKTATRVQSWLSNKCQNSHCCLQMAEWINPSLLNYTLAKVINTIDRTEKLVAVRIYCKTDSDQMRLWR